MLSYVFMKILEARPRSYDRWMAGLSAGRTRRMKQEVVAAVADQARVLEIGCGTGELAAMLCARGARVEGFDANEAMVAEARQRIAAAELEGRCTVREMGVDGMDELPAGAFDAVVATLVLSELTDDERRYALEHARRVLKPGGRLVVADEVVPQQPGRRRIHAAARLPLVAATYLISRATTRPLAALAADLARAGLVVQREQRSHGGAFALVLAHRPAEEPSP